MLEAPKSLNDSQTQRLESIKKMRILLLETKPYHDLRELSVLFKAFSPFFEFTPVQSDITLEENDKVGKLVVIHTPGHTPGGICLYDPDRKMLFVGDAIRYIEGKIEAPPKQFTLDEHQARQSIEKISLLDFDLMLSGHGEPLKPNASAKVKKFARTLIGYFLAHPYEKDIISLANISMSFRS